MGSSRLPGKVMKEIKNKPLLHYMINQIKACTKVSEIIIATTNLKEDEQIVSFGELSNVHVFKGSSEDVLDRYYRCAKENKSKSFVRLSGDSPFIDSNIIDQCISKFENNNVDYLSNTIKKTKGIWVEGNNGFPIGMSVEVFTFNALEEAWKKSTKSSDREHVTEYIFHNPSSFKLESMEYIENLSDLRLVIDYLEDYNLATKIITSFPEGELFTIKKLKNFLNQNPKLKMINSIHIQHDF
jgi:spore coat polysaccharide biosynthesis protein SpsF